MEETKYIRTIEGDMIEDNENGQSIFNVIKNGDLLRIQYYSVKDGKRVTRLFEVEFKAPTGHLIQLSNVNGYITIYNGEFAPCDQESNPVIEAIIPCEKLANIEQQLSSGAPALK